MLLKRAGVLSVLLVALAAPAWADLHFTMRTEAHPVASSEPGIPMIGAMMIKTMLPDGFMDTTYWVSEKGVRVQMDKAIAMMPAGAVMLRLANGAMIVMNPKEHSYWTLALPSTLPPQLMAGLAQMQPVTSVVHTGESMTIADVPTEHVVVTSSFNLPIPQGGQVPPGMPSAIITTMDLWVAPRYEAYGALMNQTIAIPAVFGMEAPQAQGFIMRSVTHNSLLPGYDMETVVTKIVEEPAPADAFDIPADYKEVASPIPAMGPGQPPGGAAPRP
jgi:Domain of unknown function (DUF4412)